MRIAFMGTPDFAVPTLEALLASRHEVVAVYTQPPRKSGRGQATRPSPVHRRAEEVGIPIYAPARLRGAAAQADFAALDLDAAVVAAYGLILPQPVLAAPRHGCVNVHASLLPRWRGAAPIQRAIEAGDEETGVSIMVMDAGLDTGPVLATARVPIGPATTGGGLHDVLAALGAETLLPAIEAYVAGRLVPVPQPVEGATYARKIDAGEGRLDWTQPAALLERRVRAFTPWPGTSFVLGEESIKVLAAAVAPSAGPPSAGPPSAGPPRALPPGTVLDDRLSVACGTGALRLLRLQRPGRRAVDADAFLRGFALRAGTLLE